MAAVSDKMRSAVAVLGQHLETWSRRARHLGVGRRGVGGCVLGLPCMSDLAAESPANLVVNTDPRERQHHDDHVAELTQDHLANGLPRRLRQLHHRREAATSEAWNLEGPPIGEPGGSEESVA